MKRVFKEISVDLIGSILIGISLAIFAKNADFAPGGVNGLALISNYLFNLPIGAVVLAINVPIIILTYKYLGKKFLLRSIKTMIISALIIDYLMPIFPSYQGDRLLASIFTGGIAGIGYALIYMQDSSTGGSDFIILMMKKLYPHISIGQITQITDGTIIILGWLVFGNIDALLYGVIATIIASVVIDKIMYGAVSGKLVYIVTAEPEMIAEYINDVVGRGSTFLKAQGTFSKQDRKVVMCACSRNQVYKIKKLVEEKDPSSILIITESHEVYGYGFMEYSKN